jgi:hypothetical protein
MNLGYQRQSQEAANGPIVFSSSVLNAVYPVRNEARFLALSPPLPKIRARTVSTGNTLRSSAMK